MKNVLLKLSVIVMLCCAMLACDPDDTKLGFIYGEVTDFASGEPIANANVRLNPRGETTLTGTDGYFQFNKIPAGSYTLSLSKNGYADLDDDYVINIEKGNSVQRDVQLQKKYYSLQLVDNGGNVITMLDLGTVESVTQGTFSIYNNGNVMLDFVITSTAEWIEEIIPSSGSIPIGDVQAITIKINGNLLVGGENTTTLIVRTPNMGAVQITIKVKKSGVPSVVTGEVTDVSAIAAACGGNVTSEGGSYVTERGICWNTAPNPTYENHVEVLGQGTGLFTCNLTGLDYNTTYYVRAFAKNSYGISYGEERSFTTMLLPEFEFAGHTYYVARDPNIVVEWNVAEEYCNHLAVEGMTGWRMPTRIELLQMYSNITSIGGFCTDGSYGGLCSAYWSSTLVEGSDDLHWYVFFDTGTDWYNHGINAADRTRCRVRPIREKD